MFDVLLLLIHLTNVQNRFQHRRVEFTRYELLKFLGWPRDGKSHRRLSESLLRWTTVTLHYKQAWWSRKGRRWVNHSFHVIGSLELRGRDDYRDDGRSSFTWDDVIFQSFQSGNLKRIDLNVYFGLQLAVSKQMYRFLDKRFWHKSQLEFDLRQFALEHIGLSRRYDTHEIKRKLTPAIEELQTIGFLDETKTEAMFQKSQTGKWTISLRRASPLSKQMPSSTKWESELTSRGISRSVARKLASEFSPEYLAEKIANHDTLVENRDPCIRRNPAGFLAVSIRDDYRTSDARKSTGRSDHRVTKSGTRNQPSVVTTSSPVDEKRLQDDLQQFGTFWKSLTATQREEFEGQAVAASAKFHRDTLTRLQRTDRSLYSQLRTQLLGEHWCRFVNK